MPILILGHTPKEEVGELIKNNITQAVTCKAKALEYSEEAVKCGGILKIHIKVDTGMSRLGYLCDGEYFDSGVLSVEVEQAVDVSGRLQHLAAAHHQPGHHVAMRFDDAFVAQRPGEDAPGVRRALGKGQRPAQIQNVALDRPSLRQTRDGLIHHRLIDALGDVGGLGPLIDEGLDVALGKHAAAGGDGVGLFRCLGGFVHLLRAHFQQRGHLLDKCPAAAAA